MIVVREKTETTSTKEEQIENLESTDWLQHEKVKSWEDRDT